MFSSVLNSTVQNFSIQTALLCTGSALIMGLIIAFVYMTGHQYSKSFAITLVLMPPLIETVILVVNGNLGTSVAVLGAFSLVRFRSVPGSSREICCIFFAMVVGLTAGTGYLTFAFFITVFVSLVLLLLFKTPFGEAPAKRKTLKVTIPETLDYSDIFDDLFQTYTRSARLHQVKTTNLGSLFELTYHIELKDPKKEKEFLDAIRCRNGNLTISCGRMSTISEEL